jgi:hypothetical protein
MNSLGSFSQTGNLRTHVKKSHKREVMEVKKGTASGEDIREAISKFFLIHCECITNTLIEFYKKVMDNHNAITSGAANDHASNAASPEPVETPRKAPPKAPILPDLPRKKDNSVCDCSNQLRMHC